MAIMQFNSVQFNLASTIVFDGGSSFLAFSITEASSTTSIGASLQGVFFWLSSCRHNNQLSKFPVR